MEINKRDLNKCGIYCIRNIVNNKVYIGKSKNIYTRMMQHVYNLQVKSKDENRHLINSWHKYGRENFSYYVIEYIFDENVSAGQVIRATDTNGTNIEAGMELPEGTNVILYVSKGPEGFPMPNVIGYTENDAKEIVEAINQKYPDIEVNIIAGGQPVYYYIISIE